LDCALDRRGAAPIQRAIEAGDRETGITIMQMDAGLDTGPILLTHSIPIADDDTGATLHDKLAELGAQAIVDALARLERGELAPLPQPQDGVTYARKIGRDDAWLDWTLPAPALANRVRAFDPVPGAATALAAADSPVLKIWRAAPEPLPRPAAPGTVILAEADRIVVAAGNATALRLLELQRPGGRRLPAAEFLRGHPLAAGAQLRAAPPRAD
ncbi:MAG TPA: methionyl-tRNA formyltransferase, partial [Burkholderiaceae bacterium]|nr:methionyl-tRNA formyltransferase [Burkholderiaceae bacterium]